MLVFSDVFRANSYKPQILFGSLTSSFRNYVNGESPAASAKKDINRLSLYLFFLSIAELVAMFIGTAGFSIIGEHISLRIRQQYLKAVLRQDVGFFDTTNSGEVASRISMDINLIQDGISEKVALILSGLSAFAAALIISFIKSWKLTLINIVHVETFH